MANTNTNDEEPLPPLTVKQVICYFTYKDFKPFPFDHKVFIHNVNYFYINKRNLDEGQQTPLISDENNTDFTKEIIENFISYCEGKSTLKLTNDNVFSLFKLFQEYGMDELKMKAIKYIALHNKHLILKKFNNTQNEIKLNDKEEESISQLLNEYIDHPKFLHIPFHSIHRIFEKFRSNTPIEKSTDELETKIKNFIFNYFQANGSRSSILFNFIDYVRFAKEIIETTSQNPLFKRQLLSEEVLDYLLSFSANRSTEGGNSMRYSNIFEEDFEKFKSKVFKELTEKVDFPYLNVIPEKGFQFAHFVVSITIPESVSEICDGAFYCCQNLCEVKIKPFSRLKSIGNFAFNGCINLRQINIPDSVSLIGSECFRSCQKLSDVSIPSNLKEIKNCTFYDCMSIKSVKIPDSVVTLGGSSFFNCIDLETVEFGQNIESIQSTAFWKCSSLKSIQLPPNLKSIGDKSFSECLKLESVQFPPNLETIGNLAFWCCPGLKEVSVPYKVKAESNSFTVGTSVKTLNEEV